LGKKCCFLPDFSRSFCLERKCGKTGQFRAMGKCTHSRRLQRWRFNWRAGEVRLPRRFRYQCNLLQPYLSSCLQPPLQYPRLLPSGPASGRQSSFYTTTGGSPQTQHPRGLGWRVQPCGAWLLPIQSHLRGWTQIAVYWLVQDSPFSTQCLLHFSKLWLLVGLSAYAPTQPREPASAQVYLQRGTVLAWARCGWLAFRCSLRNQRWRILAGVPRGGQDSQLRGIHRGWDSIRGSALVSGWYVRWRNELSTHSRLCFLLWRQPHRRRTSKGHDGPTNTRSYGCS